MKDISKSIWTRTGDDTMSRGMFMNLYMFWTVVGLALTSVGAYFTLDWEIGIWSALGILAVAIVGVVISNFSDSWSISALGYMLVAGPFGALIGPYVNQYSPSSVFVVALLTLGLTVVLGLAGALIPKSLDGMYPWLLMGLWLLIAGGIINWFVGGEVLFMVLNWVGVAIFSVYIVVDVNRAKRLPATANNAVDAALALYLDIVNLFIRLLAIFGQSSGGSRD